MIYPHHQHQAALENLSIVQSKVMKQSPTSSKETVKNRHFSSKNSYDEHSGHQITIPIQKTSGSIVVEDEEKRARKRVGQTNSLFHKILSTEFKSQDSHRGERKR